MQCVAVLFVFLAFVAISHGIIYVKDITTCPESKLKFNFHDKGMGPNGKQIIDVEVDVPMPIDDTYTAQVVVYKDVNGMWEKVYAIPKKLKACRAIELLISNIWFDLQKHSGKEIGSCPIEGKLKFNGYEIDSSHIKLAMAPKGKLNVTVDVMDKDDNRVTCEYYILNNE